MSAIPSLHGAGRFWTGPLNYVLPAELIAQRPVPVRSDSRLMVVERRGGRIEHHHFSDLPAFVRSRDLLVANDSAVFRARLAATKPTGGAVEILLLALDANGDDGSVAAMVRSSKPVKSGQRLELTDGTGARIGRALGAGRFQVGFEAGTAAAVAERLGEVPLPPYIERPQGAAPEDADRYQTVYARAAGSVAAPTAGLHFTPALLAELTDRGVGFDCVTLHVGPGTFTPLRGDVGTHRMEAEHCSVGPGLARGVAAARAAGGRVIAVGTTSVRALESAALESGMVGEMPGAWEGATSLFIRPGHRFQAVDGLVTNFHLPESTLLCLVMAFAGEDLIREAYECGVRERYRFYSFGDAMLVI